MQRLGPCDLSVVSISNFVFPGSSRTNTLVSIFLVSSSFGRGVGGKGRQGWGDLVSLLDLLAPTFTKSSITVE